MSTNSTRKMPAYCPDFEWISKLRSNQVPRGNAQKIYLSGKYHASLRFVRPFNLFPLPRKYISNHCQPGCGWRKYPEKWSLPRKISCLIEIFPAVTSPLHLRKYILRGHVQMTSAKFSWSLTPSLPPSELVRFAYTPLYWRRHIWAQPPPPHIVFDMR